MFKALMVVMGGKKYTLKHGKYETKQNHYITNISESIMGTILLLIVHFILYSKNTLSDAYNS